MEDTNVEAKPTLAELKNLYRKKTSTELLNIIKNIENDINVLKNRMQKTEEEVMKLMGYPTIEATKNGLISFWGKRKESEARIQKLNSDINSLIRTSDIENDNNPAEESEINKFKTSMMGTGYKIGDAYVNMKQELDDLQNLIIYLNGVIAEKKLQNSSNSVGMLQKFLANVSTKQEQPEVAKQPQDSSFGGFKKGFYK